MSASTEKKYEIDWKVILPKPRWVAWALGLISVLYFVIDLSIFSLNPFIGSFHDLTHPKSNWIFETPLVPENCFFILLAISFIPLTYSLYIIFHAFYNSKLSEKNNNKNTIKKRRIITIDWLPKPTSAFNTFVLILSIITAICTFIEIIWIKSFNNHLFAIFVMLLRCTVWVFSLGVVITAFLNDYLKNIRLFISYFYPSIASILILGFALVRVEQTNSLLIDLLSCPLNFGLFSLFFLVAIILVWFSPSYLLFTDKFFEDKENLKNFKKHHDKFTRDKNLYFKLLYRHKDYLIKIIDNNTEPVKRESQASLDFNNDPELRPDEHESGDTTASNTLFAYKDKEPRDFTIIRRLLGLSYIIVLVSLTSKVIADVYSLEPWFRPSMILISIASPLTAWYIVHNRIRNKKPLHKIIRGLIFFFIALQIACLLIVLFWNWEYALISLLVTVVISSVIFILVAFYRTARQLIARTPGYEITKEQKDYLKEFNKFATSIMLMINFWAGRFALLFWFLLLLLPLSIQYLQFINPINIYLLLVNGLIAYITVIDRRLTIKNKIQKIKDEKAKDEKVKEEKTNIYDNTKYHYKIWTIIFIVTFIVISFNRSGNSFHEINYIPADEIDRSHQYETYNSLEEYTQQFINKLGINYDTLDNLICDTTKLSTSTQDSLVSCSYTYTIPKPEPKPIILIAADGGGLKAAYWTMLILHRLDSLGLYENNVFLTSGASGGSIGLGIYNYLKAQDLTLPEIYDKIEALAATNFLSTDFAGLLGKFPIEFLPDFYGIHEWKHSEDRMDAMSKAYFTIANQDIALHHLVLKSFPYSYLWNKELEEKNGYQLPLFILNSAKADDGTKGWVHPFQEDDFLASGIVDLSVKQHGDYKSYISYPDALFLTNRFPLLSPAGKVEGEGHFVDVGAVENSGLGTIAQVLKKMHAKQDTVSAYKAFFQQKLIILSLRNAKSRYIKDKFEDEVKNQLNRSFSQSEISTFLSSVAQAGITGVPKKLDEVFSKKGEVGVGFDIKFKRINLPFLIDDDDPHYVFQNQITKDISGKVKVLNNEIYKLYGCDDNENKKCKVAIVPPPLGRLVVKPSRDYAKLMLEHPDVKSVLDSLP